MWLLSQWSTHRKARLTPTSAWRWNRSWWEKIEQGSGARAQGSGNLNPFHGWLFLTLTNVAEVIYDGHNPDRCGYSRSGSRAFRVPGHPRHARVLRLSRQANRYLPGNSQIGRGGC